MKWIFAFSALFAGASSASATTECEHWSSRGLYPHENYEIVAHLDLPPEVFREVYVNGEALKALSSPTGKPAHLALVKDMYGGYFIIGSYREEIQVFTVVPDGYLFDSSMRALKVEPRSLHYAEGVDWLERPVACRTSDAREVLIEDRFDSHKESPRPRVRIWGDEDVTGRLGELRDGLADPSVPVAPSGGGGLADSLGETLKPKPAPGVGGSLADIVPKRDKLPPAEVVKPDAEAAPPDPPGDDKPVLAPEPETPTFSVCDALTSETLAFALPDGTTDTLAVGRLSGRGPFEAFQRLDAAPDIVLPYDDPLMIDHPAPGALVPLALPFGRSGHDVAGKDAPLQSVAIPGAKLRPVGSKPVETAPLSDSDKRRIVVAADPRILKRSDLSQLDLSLGTLFDKDQWGVEWLRVEPDGSLAAVVNVTDFSTLEALGTSTEGEFFVNGRDSLDRLLDGLAGFMTSTDRKVDMLVLLLEGQRVLPPETPVRLDAFLNRVSKDGNLPRRSRGEAYPWFMLISGHTDVSYNLSYLEGPIKDTGSGTFIAEDRSLGASLVPFDTSSQAVVALRRALGRGLTSDASAPIGEAPDLPEALYLFDRAKVLSEFGLVLPIAKLSQLRDSLPFPEAADSASREMGAFALNLLSARTSDAGRIRETGAPRGLANDGSAPFSNSALKLQKTLGGRSYEGCDFLYIMLEDAPGP